jgi:phosphatidylserine/phosphatidylglycerophosphate/cardiolipin synthase-like enzyme
VKPELVALLDHVTVIGRRLSPDTVGHLAARVSRLSGADDGSTLTSPNATERQLVSRLVMLWRAVPAVSGASLGLALLAAGRTSAEVAAEQVVELVWTGPRVGEVPVRRNDQALLEVIDGAQQELLIVSYVVYGVPAVAAAIGRALDRGVSVRLVFEFDGTDDERDVFDPIAALGDLPAGAEVYEWPIESRPTGAHGKPGIIHVKCAVADRETAFVSSANLTGKAMERNMELGVIVRGGTVPLRIATQFERLVADGILALRH